MNIHHYERDKMIVAQFEGDTTKNMTMDELTMSIVEIDDLNMKQQIRRDIFAEALNARMTLAATLIKNN